VILHDGLAHGKLGDSVFTSQHGQADDRGPDSGPDWGHPMIPVNSNAWRIVPLRGSETAEKLVANWGKKNVITQLCIG